MSAAPQQSNVVPFRPAPTPDANQSRHPFTYDGALESQGPLAYVARRQPFETVAATWLAQISAEQLQDIVIPYLQALTLDWRDGAICRGQGGSCYTPHGFSQLVNLMRAKAAPGNLANNVRWLSPLARHHAWNDIVARSDRPRAEEGVLRMFKTRDGKLAVRAVVSGRHSLEHFDDKAIVEVLKGLPSKPVTMAVTRGWDETYGTCMLEHGTNPSSGVKLAFSFRNSETGCASLGFSGSLVIEALDAVVQSPNGAKFERLVQIATNRGGSRRRHTLPRKQSDTSHLPPAARQRIANRRIADDVASSLDSSRVLAERWIAALSDVNPGFVQFASVSAVDDFSLRVLRDMLIEQGHSGIAEEPELLKQIVQVVVDNARLRELPAGSAAHIAGAIAAVAATGSFSWEQARELQQLAGRFVVEGWAR